MTTQTDMVRPARLEPALQRVIVISKHPQVHDLLETVLDAGHYDVIFVESTEHAYSQIKRVAPDLVIICLEIDDPDGFQVLSMLKLDSDTKLIPVLTCTTEREAEASADDAPEVSEDVFLQQPPAFPMN